MTPINHSGECFMIKVLPKAGGMKYDSIMLFVEDDGHLEAAQGKL